MSVSFDAKNHKNRVSVQWLEGLWGVGGQTFSLTNSLGAQNPSKNHADSLKNAKELAGFTVSVLLNHITEQAFKFSALRKATFAPRECGQSRAVFEGAAAISADRDILSFSKN